MDTAMRTAAAAQGEGGRAVTDRPERRRAERRPVRLRIVCNDGRAFRSGTVLDASVRGVKFRAPGPMEVGTRVELLPLGEAGESLFGLPGTVVRCEPAGDRPDRWHVAVAFEDLDAETEAAVAEVLELAGRGQAIPLDPDPPPPSGDDPGPDESIPHMRIRMRINTKLDFGES